jgi:hypothetical protein
MREDVPIIIAFPGRRRTVLDPVFAEKASDLIRNKAPLPADNDA